MVSMIEHGGDWMAVVIVLCVVSLAKRCPRGCGATLLPLWTKERKIVRGGIGKMDQCGRSKEKAKSQPVRSKIETPKLTQYGHKIKPNWTQQKQIQKSWIHFNHSISLMLEGSKVIEMTKNARQFQQKWYYHKNESLTDIENFEMNFDLISMYQLCFYFRKLEISV